MESKLNRELDGSSLCDRCDELRCDNAFLQDRVTFLQRNLDGYITKYERLSQAYDSALDEIRRLQTIIVP